MNLGQLRTEVRLRATVPATDGMWTDTFVNSAINTALADLSLEHPWWWLQTSASPAHTGGAVDLSGVTPAPRKISHVHIGTNEAQRVSVAEAELASGLSAPPYLFSVWGETLQILPAPAGTITVHYIRDEPVLTTDADVPLMPAVYHPVIVERACSVGFESVDDQSSAAMHEARARNQLEQMATSAVLR